MSDSIENASREADIASAMAHQFDIDSDDDVASAKQIIVELRKRSLFKET